MRTYTYSSLTLHAVVIFFLSLSSAVKAVAAAGAGAAGQNQAALGSDKSSSGSTNAKAKKSYYAKGDLLSVTCLNRTLETGEHIIDDHGNLQYIPFFATCAETNAPLSFAFDTPESLKTCTIAELPDELYHLLEFFIHSDVPLTCRVPTYPLSGSGAESVDDWTPLTIALHGTLQLSHLHLHSNINVLFHTTSTTSSTNDKGEDKNKDNNDEHTLLLAATAYSVPEIGSSSSSSSKSTTPREGTKVIRNEPLTLTFNVGWIDGAFAPGMVAPLSSLPSGTAANTFSSSSNSNSNSNSNNKKGGAVVVKHTVGFSLLSFFACAASAGIGAMAMLVYERRNKRSIYSNGILGGNIGGLAGSGSTATATATGFFANLHNSFHHVGIGANAAGGAAAAAAAAASSSSARTSGYGGYGGYHSHSGGASTATSISSGKRD